MDTKYDYKIYTTFNSSSTTTSSVPTEDIEKGWEFVSYSTCAGGSCGCYIHILMRREVN